MSLLSMLRQARALAALGALLAFAGPWACLPRGGRARRRLAAFAWSILLQGFGIRIRTSGARATGAVLFAANHMSWTDIAVLGRLLDADFVAKMEVSGWPVLGALARGYGCLFVDRGARSGAGRQAQAVERHLAAERSLILFPEGTTGDGGALLPFRSSLFAVAGAGRCVQPVAICYLRRDGAPLTPARRRLIAWLGDDALLPHALALAAFGGITAQVSFEEPVIACDRKQLATVCSEAIAARLGELQAATLKRAA